jgi:F0F1-type ATP synthase assembly protein I
MTDERARPPERRADAGKAPEGSRPARGMLSGAAYAGLGVQFAAAILVFLFAGQWLDRRLGTTPWLMLLGVLLGAGGGIYSMYRRLVRPPKK